MLGNIMIFVVGVGIGGGLVIYHKSRIQAAIRAERKEIARLRAELHEKIVRDAEMNAFNDGFDAGARAPMSDAERFARTFEHQKVTFALRKEAENGSEAG